MNGTKVNVHDWGRIHWAAWAVWVLLTLSSPILSLWVAGKFSPMIGFIITWTVTILPGILIFSSNTKYRAPEWVHVISIIVTLGASLLAYGMIYTVTGVLDDEVKTHDITTSIYFSVVTFTTVGYGDVAPTPAGRPVAASEALLGYILLGVFSAYVVKSLGRLFGVSNRRTS